MTDIVLFHSVLGLRAVEARAADRLRAAGHTVSTPDLYAGRTADTIDDGFAIKDRVGWEVMTRRAFDAVRGLPAHTVLAGLSMGAGVVHEVLPHRPDTAGVLLLHGLATIPFSGLPVQLHVADPDPFAPPAAVTAWQSTTTNASVFTYPGVGHFYTDADFPDHDEQAAALTWHRVLAFLDTLPAGTAPKIA